MFVLLTLVAGAGSAGEEEDLGDLVARKHRLLAAFRRDDPSDPPPCERVTRERLREILAPGLERSVSLETLAALGQIHPRMAHTIPEFVEPTQEILLNAAVMALAGVYDPETKKIALAEHWPEQIEGRLVANELTHARQDRRVGLARFLDAPGRTTDVMNVRQAVSEGEATVVEVTLAPLDMLAFTRQLLGPPLGRSEPRDLHLLSNKGYDTSAAMMGGPSTSVAFAYVGGGRFVGAVLRQGGWAAVDRLLVHPPASTEQIIHPVKYLKNVDLPTMVVIPPLGEVLGPDWRVVGEDVLGEAHIAGILAMALPQDEVIRASTGWDGDRLLLLSGKEKEDRALVWALTMDSPGDGAEVATALTRVLGPTATVSVRGHDVAVVIGLPAPLAALVAKKALRIEHRRAPDDRGPIGDDPSTRAEERRLLARFAERQEKIGYRDGFLTSTETGVRIPVPDGWEALSPRKIRQRGTLIACAILASSDLAMMSKAIGEGIGAREIGSGSREIGQRKVEERILEAKLSEDGLAIRMRMVLVPGEPEGRILCISGVGTVLEAASADLDAIIAKMEFLPASEVEVDPKEGPVDIEIQVEKNGRFRMGTFRLDLAGLEARLRKAVAKAPRPDLLRLVIASPAPVDDLTLLRILDLLRRPGIDITRAAILEEGSVERIAPIEPTIRIRLRKGDDGVTYSLQGGPWTTIEEAESTLVEKLGALSKTQPGAHVTIECGKDVSRASVMRVLAACLAARLEEMSLAGDLPRSKGK
jgi:hypothetical protein